MVSEFENGWHVSSFSASGNCVEVWRSGHSIQVRHSQNQQGPMLTFSEGEWKAFVLGVKDGQFDITDKT